MGIQTTFTVDAAAAAAGQLVDAGMTDKVSAIATVVIPFGVFVGKGSGAAGTAMLPTATGQVTTGGLGVALKDQMKGSVGSGYEVNDVMQIVRKGRVWVSVEGAVTAGNNAFVRFASGGGGTQKGAFRADADTATAVALPNAVFASTTAAAGFAIVDLNLPGVAS